MRAEDSNTPREPAPSDAELKALYERYARPLEAAHHGEFIAISRSSGQHVLGHSVVDVLSRARAQWGPGNAVFRIGPRVVARLR